MRQTQVCRWNDLSHATGQPIDGPGGQRQGELRHAIDLIGGQLDMAFSPLPEALPPTKSGKLVAVAVLGEKRATSAPEIPTLREGGLNNVVLSAWINLLLPAKKPQPIVDKFSKSAKAFLKGDAKTKLIEIGMEPAADETKPLAQLITEEIRIHADLVKAAGLVPQQGIGRIRPRIATARPVCAEREKQLTSVAAEIFHCAGVALARDSALESADALA